MTPSRLESAGILAVIIFPLLGTIIAINQLWNHMVGWTDIALMLGLYLLSGLGITIGFHRMMVHRSFEAPAAVRAFYLILGCMALEGTPLVWGSTHIKHHAKSDTEEDPHSPLKGFLHAHIGWVITGERAEMDKYGSVIIKDPVVRWVSKTFIVWVVLGMLVPYLIAGWQGFLWGGLVRIFLTHHITWSVNSISHMYGGRMFATNDASRNNWVVGIFAFGEGWHNNHHAFPRSAFHGLRWWQIDLSGYIIRAMERVGLIKSVWRIPPERFEARLLSSSPGLPEPELLTNVEDSEEESSAEMSKRPKLFSRRKKAATRV